VSNANRGRREGGKRKLKTVNPRVFYRGVEVNTIHFKLPNQVTKEGKRES